MARPPHALDGRITAHPTPNAATRSSPASCTCSSTARRSRSRSPHDGSTHRLRLPLLVGALLGGVCCSSRRRPASEPAAGSCSPLRSAAFVIGWWQYRSIPADVEPPVVWWLLPPIAVVCTALALVVRNRLAAQALAILAALELAAWLFQRRGVAFRATLPTDAPYWLDRGVVAATAVTVVVLRRHRASAAWTATYPPPMTADVVTDEAGLRQSATASRTRPSSPRSAPRSTPPQRRSSPRHRCGARHHLGDGNRRVAARRTAGIRQGSSIPTTSRSPTCPGTTASTRTATSSSTRTSGCCSWCRASARRCGSTVVRSSRRTRTCWRRRRSTACARRSPSIVEVEECYIHCAKALRRSGVWDPATWLTPEERTSGAEVIVDQFQLDVTADVVEADLEEDYQATLWVEPRRAAGRASQKCSASVVTTSSPGPSPSPSTTIRQASEVDVVRARRCASTPICAASAERRPRVRP